MNCDNCSNQDEKKLHLCRIYGLCYYRSHSDYTGAFCEHFRRKGYIPNKGETDVEAKNTGNRGKGIVEGETKRPDKA